MKKQTKTANANRKRVVFSLDDPNAKEVILMGDFNHWNPAKHPMKKNKNGIWEKYLFLPTGTYEYKFQVDGDWYNDPDNRHLCNNKYGTKNNFIVVS